MKKMVGAGLVALCVIAACQQEASAWVNSRFSVGLNWGYQSGGNNFLWGAFKNGQPPGPEAFGAPSYAPSFVAPAPQPHSYAPAPQGQMPFAYYPQQTNYGVYQLATYPRPVYYYPAPSYFYYYSE